MKLERDILVRAVFPRLRDRIKVDSISLYEVDLRWGVSQADVENRKAVRLCLEEIDTCYPLFFCVLGERYGWRPSLTEIERIDSDPIRMMGIKSGSITEIEIRHALGKASLANPWEPKPIFMFRTRRFSAELGANSDDPSAMESLKKLVRDNVGDSIVEYGNSETFEAKAETLLVNALNAWKRSNSTSTKRQSTPILERPAIQSALRHACAASRPVVLTGAPNAGLSSVGKLWAAEAGDRGVVIDGRGLGQNGFAQAGQNFGTGWDQAGPYPLSAFSSGDWIEQAIVSLTRSGGAKGRIFMDHFEEGFLSGSQADLSCLPFSLPRGIEVVIATRLPRLLTAAKNEGFGTVEVQALTSAESRAVVEKTLSLFGKRLAFEQVEGIVTAPFARRVGALALCLDELRRYGQFESLNERLGELVACASDDELIQCVLEGVRGSVPAGFSSALNSALVALSMSLRGLTEDELSYAATAVEGERLPPLVWSTLRIGLGRAIQWRGSRIDLTSGAVRGFAEALIARTPELARQVGARLLDHLANTNVERWVEEAPQVIFLTDGECGLARHLSVVGNMVQLLAFAKTYAAGCLERLSPGIRTWTCNKWLESIHESQAASGSAWDLGNLAAQVGATEAAKGLFEVDYGVNQNRPDRQVLEVLALKSAAKPESLESIRLWRIPELGGPGIEAAMSRETLARIWAEAATVLGLLAEGLAHEDPARQDDWCRIAVESARALRDDGALSHAHLLIGQLHLGLARWKRAASSFENSTRYARRCGNARRLVNALEREATTALELNRFNKARTRALECLSIANQCSLFVEECLGFERLIEVERRRVNWERAFELARLYLERTQALNLNVERAEACLSGLEKNH